MMEIQKDINSTAQMDKFNTPKRCAKNVSNENALSTPLFVPPTPLLKNLGYGTGMFFFLL